MPKTTQPRSPVRTRIDRFFLGSNGSVLSSLVGHFRRSMHGSAEEGSHCLRHSAQHDSCRGPDHRSRLPRPADVAGGTIDLSVAADPRPAKRLIRPRRAPSRLGVSALFQKELGKNHEEHEQHPDDHLVSGRYGIASRRLNRSLSSITVCRVQARHEVDPGRPDRGPPPERLEYPTPLPSRSESQFLALRSGGSPPPLEMIGSSETRAGQARTIAGGGLGVWRNCSKLSGHWWLWWSERGWFTPGA